MTLGAMWVRSLRSSSELVAISDSRVGGGKVWDQAPKLLPLSRGDCILSFSGDTDYAYPMLLHAMIAIDSWEESQNRRFTLENLRGALTKMFNASLAAVDYSGRSDPPDDSTYLLLGGYSWWSQKWLIWSLNWHASTRTFRQQSFRVAASDQRGLVVWTGTPEAVADAKRRYLALLRSGLKPQVEGLNMQPLEIVRDIIRSGEYDSVGGPLQLGKVYRNLDSRLFVVNWVVDGTQQRTLAGRTLLGAESSLRLATIDPDRPSVFDYPAVDTSAKTTQPDLDP